MSEELLNDAQENNQSTPVIYTSPPLGYPNLATQNSIRVLFHGLLISSFATNGNYLVNAYNGALATHQPRLRVFERGVSAPIGDYIYDRHFGQDTPLKLEVMKPLPSYRQPGKFQPGDFDRTRDGGVLNYRHDFRWLPNFATDLYGVPLTPNGQKLKPKLELDSGLVYTANRTILLDKHKRLGQRQHWGRVAEFSAANIYFDPAAATGACARLLINNIEMNAFNAGKQYLIYWDNTCPPQLCDPSDEVVDMSQLGDAFDKQGNDLVDAKRCRPCNYPDTISEQEENEGDIRGRFEQLAPTVKNLFEVSRFDPCGSGWIGQ